MGWCDPVPGRVVFSVRWRTPAAGGIGAATAWAYQGVLGRIARDVPFDLLHFSLHPFHPLRWAFALGLVLLHAGAFWSIATVMRLAQAADQPRLGHRLRVLPLLAWLLGAVAVGVWGASGQGLSAVPVVVAAGSPASRVA